MAAKVNRTDSPDYECSAYKEQAARWALVQDVKAGTEAIREAKSTYLPRFESETIKDWNARVKMTFANDYYSQTLADHVGLITAKDPKIEKDVPPRIQPLLENVDGEGTHWHVFTQEGLTMGLDFGHAAIWTDFPARDLSDGKRLKQFEQEQNRPYMTLVKASETISWKEVRIGGVKHIVKFVRREEIEVDDGAFGTKVVCQYRIVEQEVTRDVNGQPIGLGAITCEVQRENEKGDYITIEGPTQVLGPKSIPLRPFYCGEKLGTLYTKPFFYNLAWTSIEETQQASDDNAVRHRCNVPTPWFSGLNAGETVNMSQGISLPQGGQAGYLEPQGTSLKHNREKLEDIRAQMRRQGASMPASDGARTMTATEAAQVARQRNARLARAARSFQDAFEAALGDMAAYLQVEDGGSVHINQDYAGASIDPMFVSVCLEAFKDGVLLRDEVRHVIKTGQLPDDIDEVAAAQILDRMEQEKQAVEAKAAADKRAQLEAGANADPAFADKAA